MAQRTGRKVSSGVANLPERSKAMPATEKMQLGDGSPNDCSNGNDGSKGSPSAPKGSHKGPDRTK